MSLHSKVFYSTGAELVHVCLAIGNAVDPALQPCFTIARSLRMLVILTKESIVTAVVSLHRRRMRPMLALDHGMNHKSRNDGTIGIAGNHFGVDDFFRHHDDAFRGANAFNHHPKITP